MNLSGTVYIDAVVKQFYGGNWSDALEDFVHNSTNKWCPTWIRRNYDVFNSETSEKSDKPQCPADHEEVT